MQLTSFTNFIINKNMTKASEFLKLCLRGFSILADYRDDDLSPDIPRTLQKSTYHEEELVKAKERLAKRLAMTDEDWRKDLEEGIARNRKSMETAMVENNAAMEKLNKVKEAVLAWQCSEQYQRVKEYALNQISLSEPRECKWFKELDAELTQALNDKEAFEKYKANLIDSAKSDVEYHEHHIVEDNKKWEEDQAYLDGFWKEIEELAKKEQ